MSDTNNFETGYQDDNDNTIAPNNSGTGNGNASTGFGDPTSKEKGASKKGSKLPLLIFGVLAVVGIGAGGYFMLSGSPAPAPTPRAAAPVAPADQLSETQGLEEDGLSQEAGEGQNVDIDPITGLPVTDPALIGPQEIDPITGLPIADATQPAIGDDFNIDPSTIPTADDNLNPDMLNQSVDPITGLPIADATQDQSDFSPDLSQGQINPITGLPLESTNSEPVAVTPADPAQEFPPVQQPVQQPVQPVASNDPLAQFRDMLAPIDGRVTTLEGQVSSLTNRVDEIGSRVDRLMDRPRNDNSIHVSNAPKPAPRRAVRKAPAKPKQNNYVRMADAPSPKVAPPVSRVVIVTQGSDAHQAMVRQGTAPATATTDSFRTVSASRDENPGDEVRHTATTAPTSPSCNLQAIVPGRVWVKNTDGSFASFGEGDAWNGQTVDTIDPARGVKLGDRWVCN